APPHRPTLPADPRPDQRPGRGARRDVGAHHRPPGARVRRARARGARGPGSGLRHHAAGRRLPRVGHRRVGGRADQHALPRGHRAGLRDRPLRHAVAGDGHPARPAGGVRARRLAARRGPGGGAGAAGPGHRARDQGRLRGAQRDVHRRDQPRARRTPRHGLRRSPGAAARRHHLVAGLDRLPPRRVGRRRDRRRLPEGPDAAAGAGLQRGEREGPRGLAIGGPAEVVLGLGADHGHQPERLLALHPRHQPALRASGRPADARRGGARQRLRPSPASCRGHPCGGAGLGARGAVRRRARALGVVDGGPGARRGRRRRGTSGGAGALRHVAGRGPRQAGRHGVPHRPPRPLQRPDAGRHPVGCADGPAAGRRQDRPGRRSRGARGAGAAV
ncbi:MAG: Serine--glyoxylate aminotransferase, partial [uncultured Nocardioidaceae bacterium]